MTARPEWITVTDPAHPLYGRTFVLVSLASASGPGSCALVVYRGDIMLRQRQVAPGDPPIVADRRRPVEAWDIVVPGIYPAYLSYDQYLFNRRHLVNLIVALQSREARRQAW